MTKVGDPAAYRERARLQCLAWVDGRPQHNHVDGECTPDFSCCVPDLFNKDESARWKHYVETYQRLS